MAAKILAASVSDPAGPGIQRLAGSGAVQAAGEIA